MATERYDRGSAIVLEVLFKKHDPFDTDVAFDPTTPKITVTDSAGVVKVDAANLISNAVVGEWYYNLQTAVDWVKGTYKVKVTGSYGSYSDITILTQGFKLI